MNLDNIMPSVQYSPQTEAIFINFKGNMTNSESHQKLEQLMNLNSKTKQINVMNTSRMSRNPI